MLPKVTLKAPAGVGGTIHASGSQKAYTIDEKGFVTVDAVDVRDLTGAGFQPQPHQGDPNTQTSVPITSPSLTSDTVGAHALTQEARDASAPQAPRNTGPTGSRDFGAAIPPHGVPPAGAGDPVTAARKTADAELERQTATLSGVPADAQPSEVPNTGSYPTQAADKAAQDRAAAEAQNKG